MNSDNLFNLLKNKKIESFKKIIKKNKKNIDLDIIDENGNYLIHYLINLNNFKLIEFVLENVKLRLDVLDIEGKNLTYFPIKYNYIDILELIIKYNDINIGISIIDKKDENGYTALHYSCLFNNIDAFKLLVNKNADLYAYTSDNLTIFDILLKNEKNDMLFYVFEKLDNFKFKNMENQTLIQIALDYENLRIVDYLLDKDIDFDNIDSKYGISLLMYIVILNNNNLLKKLLKKDININVTDYTGNDAFHYAIMENNLDIILFLIDKDINFNTQNLDGNIPLHTFLIINDNISDNKDKMKILKLLIKNSDLNLQNNKGKTCLHLLIENYLWKEEDIYKRLRKKELNVFIKDNNDEDVYSKIIDRKKFLNLVADSYYYEIQRNKKNLKIKWELNCSTQDYENIIDNKDRKSCIKKIMDVIKNEKRSIPKIKDFNIKIDNGIVVNNCYYIGIPLDILFNLIYLKEKYKNIDLVLDYPLNENNELLEHYQSLGVNFEFKLKFSNIQIIWSFQRLIYPTYFDNWFNKLKNNKNKKFIIIPLGIEISEKTHANILFYDIEKNIIERFEPNGANQPKDMNYNANLLDRLLELKFKQINPKIKYIKPKDYLPQIGLQMYEIYETPTCKKLGDPNGFCAIWCAFWIDKRIGNYKLDANVLIDQIIKEIKLQNLKFKNVIRNYSKKITDIRDNYLSKYKIDINQWVNNTFDEKIINKLEKDIIQII